MLLIRNKAMAVLRSCRASLSVTLDSVVLSSQSIYCICMTDLKVRVGGGDQEVELYDLVVSNQKKS